MHRNRNTAGNMTGFGLPPDCAITGSKKEINIKSFALAFFLEASATMLLFFVLRF